MKSRFLTLLMLINFASFGQKVPNTTTFSLTDVTTITGGTSLSGAFALSVDAYFDPAYKGSKNSLLNFRNYGCVRPGGLTSIYFYTVVNGVTVTAENVCSFSGAPITGNFYIAELTGLTDGSNCYRQEYPVLTGCETLPNGYYYYYVASELFGGYQVINGKIYGVPC